MTLAPDEKECPFCFEVIKARAVVCRYCGRDLPAPGAVSPLRDPAAMDAFALTPLLADLVDKSLAVAETRDDGVLLRYRLLETVRQYSREKLRESGEASAARQRHLYYFLSLAEEARPNLRGPKEKAWMDRLEAEHENLLAALEWCADADANNAGVAGLRLAGALHRFWHIRGHLRLGRERLEAALAHPGAQEGTKERADAVMAVGDMALRQGDLSAAQPLFEQAMALYHEVGGAEGEANCLRGLGALAAHRGDLTVARSLHEQALALDREIGNRIGEAFNLNNLGAIAVQAGDLSLASSLYEQALALHREAGNRASEASLLHNLGGVARHRGDLPAARSLHEQALSLHREMGNQQGVSSVLRSLALLERDRGRFARAARLLGADDAVRAFLGVALRPDVQPEQDQTVSDLRRNLGESAFESAWQAGKAMSLEEAVAFALANADGSANASEAAP